MTNWPSGINGARWESAGVSAASTAGALLTANAVANTVGNYAQLIAATAFHASGIMLTLSNNNTAAATYLVDFAIGAAASEQILVSGLHSSTGGNANTTPVTAFFPLSIPAGSRLAARCQSSTGGATIRLHGLLLGGGFGQAIPGSIVDTYGANTADSGGTSIDPGATINTEGAWVEMTATSTRPYRAVLLGVGNQNNAAMSTARWLFDIGVGAAGSEQVVVPDIMVGATAAEDNLFQLLFGPYPVDIPAASRIAVRSQSGGNDATDRLLDAIVYGVS